jgi:DNA-binding NarL/FixJ family response regulator
MKKTKNIPVIVFSNLSEEKDIDEAKRLGAVDFMIKSNFSLSELSEHINKLLG